MKLLRKIALMPFSSPLLFSVSLSHTYSIHTHTPFLIRIYFRFGKFGFMLFCMCLYLWHLTKKPIFHELKNSLFNFFIFELFFNCFSFNTSNWM